MTTHHRSQHSASTAPSAPATRDETFLEPGLARDAELVALRQELEALRAEFAAFRAAMTPAASPEPPEAMAAPAAPASTATDENEREHSGGITTRRTLLKWGGLAAAAGLAAAGGVALTSQTAHAADGGNLVLGENNSAESQTWLSYDGSATGIATLWVGNLTSGNYAILGVTGANGTGVSGLAGDNGIGVYGYAAGNNVHAGVYGQSDSGYGVEGSSTGNVSLAATGSGRIYQHPTSAVGAPTTGSHSNGESIRDQNGDYYICVASGAPGTWLKVAALDTAYQGGAVGFLSTPIRVYDSRTNNTPLVGNGVRSIQVTGVTIGGVTVPAGATGCIGNLTVVHPTTGGYLVIYPQGSPTPSSSTVNFVAGQTVPNSFTVGLGASGQVTVHAFQSGSCHFILDITGFVA